MYDAVPAALAAGDELQCDVICCDDKEERSTMLYLLHS